MATGTTTLLAEAAARFREVERHLLGPGPLQAPLAHARRPDVWVGTVRDAFVAWLEMADHFLRERVAPGVGTLAGWTEAKAKETEDYQRALAAGTPGMAAPAAPAPLRAPVPGLFPAYAPYQGPVRGFAGMDPALVRDLARLCGAAAQETYALGAKINVAIGEFSLLLPPDAAEAAGMAAFGQVSGSLQTAVRDLAQRAQQTEVGYAAGALLGAEIPTLESLAASVAAAAAPPAMGIQRRAVRPTAAAAEAPPAEAAQPPPAAVAPVRDATADGKALRKAVADAQRGRNCEALESLAADMRAAAEADPGYAADVVNTLGPAGVNDILEAPWEDPGKGCASLFTAVAQMGNVVAAATSSDRLSDKTLDALYSARNKRLGELLSATTEFAPRAKERIFDLLMKNPEHPAREEMLDIVASDPDLALQYAMVASLGVHETLFETQESWDLLIAGMASTSGEMRNYAEAALETAIQRVGEGHEMSEEARRGLALAISTRVADLARSIERNAEVEPSSRGAPAPKGKEALAPFMHVSQNELVATMTELMKDKQARRTLELAAGSLAADWAGRTADEYLRRQAAGNETPASDVAEDLHRDSEELGQFLCATVESIGGKAKADAEAAIEAMAGMRLGIDVAFEAVDLAKGAVPGGPLVGKGADWLVEKARGDFDDYVGALEDEQRAGARRQADAAHTMADRVVWDSLASALLRRALAAPPEERDRLLAGLGVEAVADDGTRLTGVAALQDASLLDAAGHFALPKPGTEEYVQYEDWASEEARRFASRVDTLAESAINRFTRCVARHLDVERIGK